MLADRLKKGDTICLVAPSNPIQKDRKVWVDDCIKYLKSLKFNVIYSKNVFEVDKWGFSAGTPEQRAEDINFSFADKSVNAIWCIQGGETANQVLDLLDYEVIKNNPKLFMGMSDIDVLLLALHKKTGLVGFNSADPKIGKGCYMSFDYSKKSFIDRLVKGEKEIIKDSEWKCIRKGKATGKVLGCNTSSILKLVGTEYWPDFKGTILFLENYVGKPRDVLFKLTQLKLLGVFDQIAGIVVGYVYGLEDPEYIKKNPQLDVNAKQIKFEDLVMDVVKDYNFPIMKINEIGHRCKNCFLPIGGKVEMDADALTLNLIEDCVK
jgi:muramoyltetrapeptide carboxypeptidase